MATFASIQSNLSKSRATRINAWHGSINVVAVPGFYRLSVGVDFDTHVSSPSSLSGRSAKEKAR